MYTTDKTFVLFLIQLTNILLGNFYSPFFSSHHTLDENNIITVLKGVNLCYK